MSSDDTLSSVLYPVIHTQKAPSLEEPISIDYSAKCSCPNLAIFLTVSPEFIRCKSSVDVFTAVIDGKPTQHQSKIPGMFHQLSLSFGQIPDQLN